MKYITYVNKAGLADIRIFSDMEEHKDIAYEMKRRQLFELLGAGFIVGGECEGYSQSLKLDSRGEDDTAIYGRLLKC